jgi:outer membrane immunogenic protein
MVANTVRKLGLAAIAMISAASVGAAFAADLTPSYKAPVKALAPVASWNGFYVGGNVGYGWDSASTGISSIATAPAFAGTLAALVAAGSYPTSLSPSAKGAIGGGQIGYNWQMSQWLFGLEADLQGSGIKGSATQNLFPLALSPTTTSVTKSLDWFGTFRGRIGFVATPQWLLYATGGLAYGQTKASFNTFTPICGGGITLCATGGSSSTRAGWTLGAGAEAMLAPNWSVKAEYLYIDLGRSTTAAASFTNPVTFYAATPYHEQIARVGLNYHFGWGGPVVARY